jgi:hypothetical protein
MLREVNMGNAKWLEQRRDTLLEGLENSKYPGLSTVTPSDWKTSPQGIHQHVKKTGCVLRALQRRNNNNSGTSKELLSVKLVAEDIQSIRNKLSRHMADWESSSESVFVQIRHDLFNVERSFFDLKNSYRSTNN